MKMNEMGSQIIIPGVRNEKHGPSEKALAELREFRKQHKVQLWSQIGTEEECEASWEKFLLTGTPDWVIYG
jgi:hypothetical protein